MMQTTKSWIIAVASVALLSLGVAFQLMQRSAIAASGPLPSFELKRSERLRSDLHHDKLTLVTVLARRSDGAEVMVTENRLAEDRPMIERTLFFPATGIRVLVDDTVRAKSTFYYQPSDPAFTHLQLMRSNPATGCRASLTGGTVHPGPGVDETVAGIPAVKLVSEGANRHTRWLTPQLGCIEVMTRLDSPGSTAISSPDYLRLAEPDAKLFEIPPDYAEVKPSVRIDLVNAWMRRTFPAVPRGRMQDISSYRQSADQAYLNHRQASGR